MKQELLAMNDPEIDLRINQYVNEFFDLNSANKSNPDILKLLADKKILREKHFQGINSSLLDTNRRDRIENVDKYISAMQHLKHQDRSFTQLMRTVARPIDPGSRIDKLLGKLEDRVISLLNNGDNINAVDSHGRTALMYTVIGQHFIDYPLIAGRERFTKLLLSRGADPTIKDNFGKTALDYYQKFIDEKDHPAIILLKQAMQYFSQLKPKATRSVSSFILFNPRVRHFATSTLTATPRTPVITPMQISTRGCLQPFSLLRAPTHLPMLQNLVVNGMRRFPK